VQVPHHILDCLFVASAGAPAVALVFGLATGKKTGLVRRCVDAMILRALRTVVIVSVLAMTVSCLPRGSGHTAGAGPQPPRTPLSEVKPAPAPTCHRLAAASNRSQVLARWSFADAELSTDGGLSFRPVLSAPEPITAAAMADDGTFFVARHHRLGVLTHQGREVWRELPDEGRCAGLVASHGLVVWYGWVGNRPLLMLSEDAGGHFARRDLPPMDGSGDNQLLIDDDGSLTLLAHHDTSVVVHVSHDRGRTWRGVSYPRSSHPGLGHGQTTYGLRQGTLVFEGPIGSGNSAGMRYGRVRFSDGRPGQFGPHSLVRIATNGRATVGLIGSEVFRLEGGKAALLGSQIPPSITSPVLDAQGKLLALRRGQLVEFTAGGRWVAVSAWADPEQIVELATGNSWTCARSSTGTVKCWGGDSSTRSPIFEVPELTGAKQIAVSEPQGCARLMTGAISCWDFSRQGQARPGPARPFGAIDDAVDLAGGYDNLCVVRRSGSVWCWGSLTGAWTAELKGAHRRRRWDEPMAIEGVTNARRVFCGYGIACALTSSGRVTCWGDVDGDWTTKATGLMTLPQLGVDQVAIGGKHRCLTDRAGQLFCFGVSRSGIFGLGPGLRVNVPASTAEEIRLPDFTQLASGSDHSCALLQDRTVSCWGDNTYGQLGDGTTEGRLDPQAVLGLGDIVQVVAAEQHSCALSLDGGVFCWGWDFYGQVGLRWTSARVRQRRIPTAVAGLDDAVSVSSGDDYSCALRKTGQVLCWGNNNDRQMLTGAFTRSRPHLLPELPELQTLVTGDGSVCGLTADETIHCGSSMAYQTLQEALGHDGRLLRPVTALALGDDHICVADDQGNVWCGGGNDAGQLGLGNYFACDNPHGDVLDCAIVHPGGRRTPVDENARQRGRVPIAQVRRLSSGGVETCAVTAQGAVLCWGGLNQLRPRRVVGVRSAVDVSVGRGHACALLEGGKARCWGDNQFGQLGDLADASEDSPQPLATYADIIQISAGAQHACAVRRSGEVLCWGRNEHGQLGNDAVTDAPQPVAVVGIDTAVQVACGEQHTCARLRSGQVSCWGSNERGQLGDGTSPRYVERPLRVRGL
jgi:alpha-tubulin suppressor-like RCC1 family protein